MLGNAGVDIATMLAELRLGYIAELPSRLQEIEDLVLGLKGSADFTEDYQDLYRHVHSIKGSAGTHGLHIISTVCHSLEDLIVEVEGDQNLVSDKQVNTWLAFIDLLRRALDLINNGNDDFNEIEVRLAELSGHGSDYEFRGLMVMNSELHRKMCLSAFEDYPVKFSYATNGYEALGLLLKQPFDFLVTNMEVNDLQGLAMIGALRLSNNRNCKIPTILLTSKQLGTSKRVTDPDYAIRKDASLMEQLRETAKKITAQMKQNAH